MIKDKLKSILNKIKNNKKKVIGVTAIVFAVFIFTFIVYNLNNPTKFNRLFANVLNNGKPANDAFEDNTFYSCVVDAYNSYNGTSKAYTDNLTDEELASITNLSCSGYNYSDNDRITSAKGVEKLTGLTSLYLSDNQLTSIDLSKNTVLTELHLLDNKLTNIDIGNNTALTILDLSDNQLTSIDLSNNIVLTNIDISYNKLTSIDISNNTVLTTLNLSENKLINIDVSSNTALTKLYLSSNQLTNISTNTTLMELRLSDNQLTSIDLSKNTELKSLSLNYNQLFSIDLSQNAALTALDLSNNPLTSLNLSGNTALSSLYIDDTPLKEDILIQTGETYQIEEKIIPPEGQNITYSIGDTSVATIEGNTITAQSEGSTTLKTTFGNVSFNRNLVVGTVKLNTNDDDYIKINNDEKYIYFNYYNPGFDIGGIDEYIDSNIGKPVKEKDKLKVMLGNKVISEYKLIYLEQAADVTDDYMLMFLSVDNPNYINAVNCTYELLNGGNEIVVKYNEKEMDRKKLVYVYLPHKFSNMGEQLYTSTLEINDTIINNINSINELKKDKINILNAVMKFETKMNPDGEKYDYYTVYVSGKKIGNSFRDNPHIVSNNYDLSKDYIFLGTEEFENDLIFKFNYESIPAIEFLTLNDDYVSLGINDFTIDKWDLIKVSSDKYDMSGDTINLGNEDIDLTKINVTNTTLKVENDKLLIMYGDEVVKEFKLEGGKKTTTTTKNNNEKTTTTNTKTTKEEVKTTTTKKKVNIIDKIFGNTETTTKKEDTTTKKNIFRKSTTTKVENSSGNVTSDNKNSLKKLVTGSNLLILLSITGIALIIYIIVDKKKIKNNN